jgi:hypothetical protein
MMETTTTEVPEAVEAEMVVAEVVAAVVEAMQLESVVVAAVLEAMQLEAVVVTEAVAVEVDAVMQARELRVMTRNSC